MVKGEEKKIYSLLFVLLFGPSFIASSMCKA